MKWTLTLIAPLLLLLAVSGCSAQSAMCPVGMVCISPDAARKALQDSDTVKAQTVQIEVLKKAMDDTKDIITDLKVELAKATGTLTGSQQSMVDARATIQVLSANCKARNRIGLINF